MIDEKRLIEEIDYYISHTREEGKEHYAYKQAKKLIQRQPKVGDWIPFKSREADEDEKNEYGVMSMLCCQLPEENEEILVTDQKGYVYADTFLCEGIECYLDSGREIEKEAIAWMSLPAPYKPE